MNVLFDFDKIMKDLYQRDISKDLAMEKHYRKLPKNERRERFHLHMMALDQVFDNSRRRLP